MNKICFLMSAVLCLLLSACSVYTPATPPSGFIHISDAEKKVKKQFAAIKKQIHPIQTGGACLISGLRTCNLSAMTNTRDLPGEDV